MNLSETWQRLKEVSRRLVELCLIEFSPGMGLDEIEIEYRERVFGVMQDYMDSDKTVVSFRNEMKRITNDAYLLAAVAGWVDGGADGPISDELTAYVNEQVESQFVFIDDVFARLKELRKSGTPDEQDAYIEDRADGYTGSIRIVYDYARLNVDLDLELWFDGEDGSADSVCQKIGGTCVQLKGQHHPARWWIDEDLVPYRGNKSYDCGAWNCLHVLRTRDGEVWARANE